MLENYMYESPFKISISFHKLMEELEAIANSEVDYRANYANALLKQVESKPELREGIQDLNFIEENKLLIKYLLADLFPTALTHNEIKAVSLPFYNLTFNYSERFQKILQEAGQTFDMSIRDFDEHQFYVMNCTLILNAFYNQKIDFGRPLFYDIPDANGVIRHYKILYNADFVEIIPTESIQPFSQEVIEELIDNYDNLDLWKKAFPPNSWILKGFVIVSLVDVTVENAVSNLKTYLLKPEFKENHQGEDAVSIFQSVFKIPNLSIGFTAYNKEEDIFEKPPIKEESMSSFILLDQKDADCKNALCGCTYDYLIENQKTFIIPDVRKFSLEPANKNFGEKLLKQGILSCILAPVMKEDQLLGIIELASSEVRALNSINATKLDLIMPFLVDTAYRSFTDMQNQLEAVIQKEYTTIHPSVYWKFKREARNYFTKSTANQEYLLKEIVFKEVYPLYGQIDIKGSSDYRNQTVREDLKNQLESLISIFETVNKQASLLIVKQRRFELQELLHELKQELKADTEQVMQRFIETEIHPILHSLKLETIAAAKIKKYFENIDPKTGSFYHARKDFDHTLSVINKKMTSILDAKQIEAQKIYPHYYERFKTDGVEHNLYIGASIAPTLPYDKMYLSNLRLWQLQTLCEMELEHHHIKDTLPYTLEVTSLILVFSSPISIRFRMDEKRFDVDGSYNARYEVVKKRIDKAHIKGTQERITQKEKITIVFSNSNEEKEYLQYIKYLQHDNILDQEVEKFEVEELQGVSGLKALRVKVINSSHAEQTFSNTDVFKQLN